MYIKMTLTHFIIYYGKSAEGMTHVFLVKKKWYLHKCCLYFFAFKITINGIAWFNDLVCYNTILNFPDIDNSDDWDLKVLQKFVKLILHSNLK